ncbi:phage holin family protein [Schleiferia thermophila]|jgi:putative membrane protein|uniref:phage holin family protein n=1 Tax=Schleiferia thermophila TaxID=884107 RepID=UPI00068B2080|nr:phage holin family protein [Schleiferia thermophila]
MKFHFRFSLQDPPFHIRLAVSTLSIFMASYIAPGVHLRDILAAFIVALVLAVFNITIKPMLILLTLPVTLFTFGIFLFVINALVILIAADLVNGFDVSGFWSALFYSFLVSVISGILHAIAQNLSQRTPPTPPQA